MRYAILPLLLAVVAGVLVYGAWFRWDNKYTAALPGGYGYNVWQGSRDQVAFLVDGWEYYPGQLLEPEDWKTGVSPEGYTYIGEYPNFSHHLGSPYGEATYRLVVENIPSGAVLYLPELLCAGRVYINGTLVGEQGSVEPYVPLVSDEIYPMEGEGSTEIVIQCANYSHYYSGMYYPPAVGSYSAVWNMLTVRLIIYGLLCFAALSVALSYLVQYLLGRDSLMGWAGLLSLAFSLRVSYPFFRALGAPWVGQLYAVEDVCGNVVLLCALVLAGRLCGMDQHWIHRRVAIPAAAGLCLFTLIFPVAILPYSPMFINAYGLILFAWKVITGVYLIALIGCAKSIDRPMSQYLMGAAGLYALWMLISVVMANRFEPIYGAWPEEYGGFALVVGYAAGMVRRGVLLERENRHLTCHLQEEVERKTQGMETLLAERRELLAHLLHDVKNPLSALRGYAELVRSGNVDLDPETAGYLDALTQRVEVVGDRFELLQQFSRGERGVLLRESICLNQFLKEFYQHNRPDLELSGVRFTLKLPTRRLMVRGSKERLRIALENLCFNALSFTPEDGVIALSLTEENGYALLVVRDTGAGIDAQALPHIFERGFTQRPDGSGEGLGLYLVRAIALEHGGTVSVTSERGNGSVFTLRLPIVEEQ